MCNAFSCILTRKGDVLRHTNENAHSHASMIRQHKLKENSNPERTGWIRIECTPPNKQYSLPINKWIITVDETAVPLWYSEDKDSYETIIRNATQQWKKKHCIKGNYCEVELYDNGKVMEECWFRKDQLHRQDGPAWIFYSRSGSVREERWCRKDQLHRTDGPAVILYYKKDGKVKIEKWFHNDKLHHQDGPAYIYYYGNGKVKEEYWSRNDKKHRLDGPAWIFYSRSGSISVEQWYRNDQEISPLTTN